MAVTKKKKTTGTRKGSARTRTVSTNKRTETKHKKAKAAPKKHNEQAAAARKRFSEQYVPYILGGVGLILLVCFVLNFIRPDATPTQHLMGPVGWAICYFFFGLFGWTAAVIPVLLFLLAAFWRKACREGTVLVKSLLTVGLMVVISAVIHVFVCVGDDFRLVFYVDRLFRLGAAYETGGVVGGLLGFVMYKGVRLPGTIVISVVAIPLMLMLLFDVTPAYVYAKIRQAVAAAKARAAENAERRATEEEDEEKPARREKPVRPIKEASEEELYTPTRDRKKDKTEAKNSAEEKPSRRKVKNTIHVDPETGEILEDDEPEDTVTEATAQEAQPRPTEEDMAPWEDAEDDVEEDDGTMTPATDVNEHDQLYIPPVGPDGAPARRARPRSMVSAAYDTDVDDRLVDPEEPEAVELSVNDDDGREKIVVNILPQDRTVLTDSSDYHVNGLNDEEVVLPSGHAEGEVKVAKSYQFPPIDLLTRGPDHYEADEAEIIKNTQALRSVLESFNIRVKDIACSCGPTITRYEVRPDTGVRVRSIANLVDDIALGLAKSGVRIEAPIPGKSAVGIEVPNASPATVALRNLLETPEFLNHKSRIAACLGADVAGRPIIMDINKMPHLLVAGATGSGKSVCINSIIMSIIYKATPDEVKLILVDPKKVEFAVYRDLPHLYAPVVSDPKKAAGALNTVVNEMERRFELIEEVGVRNLAGYNEVTAGDPERPPLPQMVIIIDELADLMMTASNEVETAICRLAQKARAAGIHLILGTQRPSTDVITGLIKANIPSRIAFTVASQIDSRTIIDSMGAEKLIGRGDMLYAPVGVTKPLRVQGTFVSDGEVEKVITFLKEHNEKVAFDEEFMRQIEVEAARCGANGKKGGGGDDFSALGGGGDDEDAKFWAAVELAVDAEKVSTSLLQRRLSIGYGKAAKIIDQMEEMGFVGPADGNKPRKLLITKQDLMELRMNGGGAQE